MFCNNEGTISIHRGRCLTQRQDDAQFCTLVAVSSTQKHIATTATAMASDLDLKKLPTTKTNDSVDFGTVTNSQLPESLRNLSDDEMSELNKRLVRKIDRIILPIIGILYILVSTHSIPI